MINNNYENVQGDLHATIDRLEQLASSYGTSSDRLIELETKILESPARPGHFSDRLWDARSLGNRESDLPIVRETAQVIEKGRSTGRYISRQENPLGEKVTKALLFVLGDRHIAGSYPEESAVSRSVPLNIARKIGPKSWEYAIKREDWSNKERPRRSVDYTRALFEGIKGDISSHDKMLLKMPIGM